jgi:hypothetical protein
VVENANHFVGEPIAHISGNWVLGGPGQRACHRCRLFAVVVLSPPSASLLLSPTTSTSLSVLKVAPFPHDPAWPERLEYVRPQPHCVAQDAIFEDEHEFVRNLIAIIVPS